MRGRGVEVKRWGGDERVRGRGEGRGGEGESWRGSEGERWRHGEVEVLRWRCDEGGGAEVERC